ncbi:hypothetical protein NQ318_018596 [Aromia moschata]|uniref:Adenosine deaminase domain-containing protein n=1 Tax=Aromia moschata TaxID=1265417 RepID=A0AAV8ZIA3_9CUCU|nr:hypothetical protein NQ318_018596 [Aromia moschata]
MIFTLLGTKMSEDIFCRSLPKIELHAHLNGSLSEKTLRKLGCLDESILEYHKLLNIINKTDRTLDECFELFKIAQTATSSKNSVYLATQSVIEEFAQDNVIYLELRTTPRAENDMTKQEYIESVLKGIKDSKSDIIVKLILSIDRRHDKVCSEDSLDVIVKMREEYPGIIKGIDLSGNPYVGGFDECLFSKAREHGLRTTIHCAEIPNDNEVQQILNFHPERIGHATSIHPDFGGSKENWQLYCKAKIPAEFCLTSNVVCGTSKCYAEHHIQQWMKNDLPFSINTDDKGVFCTSLSKEYEHVLNNFDLSKADLWNITYNAIDHCFASTEEIILLKKKMAEWKETHAQYF